MKRRYFCEIGSEYYVKVSVIAVAAAYSHDDSSGIWNTLLDVFVGKNHRLINKDFILHLHILCYHTDTFDSNPVPDDVLPANDWIPDKYVPLDLCLWQNCRVRNARTRSNFTVFANDDIRAKYCRFINLGWWMNQYWTDDIVSFS